MPALSRTPSGAANASIVRRGKVVVWVEGPDDMAFWPHVFPCEYGGCPIIFKPYGGSLEHIAAKLGTRRRVLIAMDGEYDRVLRNRPRGSRIVKTSRHSVENYLYDPLVLNEVMSVACRGERVYRPCGDAWARAFVQSFRGLLVLQVAAMLRGEKVCVFGNSSEPLLKKNSWRADPEKVAKRARQHAASRAERDRAKAAMHGIDPLHLFRGHFIEGSARRFIIDTVSKTVGSRHHVAKEALFTTCCFAIGSRAIRTQLLGGLRRRAYDALRAAT